MAFTTQRGGTGNFDQPNIAQSGAREDLANFVSMITRDETPFMSDIGKTKATAILHEWQTDELETPGSKALTESSNFSSIGQADGERSRLSNYTQINGKTLNVSGTRRAIDIAGVADEYAYQLKKRGVEMRRDVEHDLIHGWNSSVAGTAARTFGGYQAFINDSGAEGTVIVPNTAAVAGTEGTPGTAPTIARGAADANLTPLALDHVDQVMQAIYEQGGKATRIMLSPRLKRRFTQQAQAEDGVRRNIDDSGKLRQSVDIYMSDFGELMVKPNYIMGLNFNTDSAFTQGTDSTSAGDDATNARDFSVLVYDPMWFNIATLRPMQEVEIGQLGDNTVGQIVEECTLEVRNPKGAGAVYGVEAA